MKEEHLKSNDEEGDEGREESDDDDRDPSLQTVPVVGYHTTQTRSGTQLTEPEVLLADVLLEKTIEVRQGGKGSSAAAVHDSHTTDSMAAVPFPASMSTHMEPVCARVSVNRRFGKIHHTSEIT